MDIDGVRYELLGSELTLSTIRDVHTLHRIGEALARIRSITTLRLLGGQIGAIGFGVLSEALKQNRSLSMLELDIQALGSHGMRCLADLLAFRPNIVSLLLREYLEVQWAEPLTTMLETPAQCHLRVLRLNGCRNTPTNGVVASRVVAALLHNRSVTELDLQFHWVSSEAAAAGAGIAQLIAQNHYGEVADELHRRGMHYYGEALEYHRPSLGDDMEMRTKTDIPMGAMWTYSETDGPQPTYVADLRGAASIAHIYGQNLVGAESMTSAGPAWSWYPGNLKRIADLQLALGVNRFMIHESTHEPLVDQPPGLTLGIAGQFFTRNETWAKEARPWISYLARSSYLLQQGHFYADVAYFYGEEGPLTSVFGYAPQQDAPQGYGFDFVNSDVILNHLALKDGRLVTPGGTSYRILYLGGTSRRMTLPVLRRLEELVAQGAVIVGNKPVDSPSLSDDQATFQKTADELWGTGSGSACSFHAYGKGRVYSGKTANEVLADLQVSPDYEYTRPEPDTTTMFLHRRLSDGDLYFVINRKDRPESFDAVFRVEGKSPELWDAATGLAKPASYRISDGRTTVPLRLDPYGSIFVVFRKPAAELSRQVPAPFETVVAGSGEILNQGWDVHFQPHRGAPESLRFDHLSSWSDSPNPGVKYFSGTAAYTKTIDAPSAWFKPGAHLWLDLGDVRSIAEVLVNGRSVGIAWKTPYKIDLGNTLKPGSNQLTIKVTNQWVNRIIGDQQPGVVQKHTSTDIQPYDAHSPLLPSGLLGPIQLSSITTRWRINPNVP